MRWSAGRSRSRSSRAPALGHDDFAGLDVRGRIAVVFPGAPARFNFTADAEGVFELESHTAEDAGLEPLVARLVVNPS